MAKELKGVSGVLGNIVSQEGEGEATKSEAARQAASKTTAARRGRPLRSACPSGPVAREKVSLRLRADLAATYRDWSWDERCQFSDLVDRAMEFYLKHRGKARKQEKE